MLAQILKKLNGNLQDFLSGEILYEKEPDRSIYPASMTKIMTSIIAFDLIKSGDLTLDRVYNFEKTGDYHIWLFINVCNGWR